MVRTTTTEELQVAEDVKLLSARTTSPGERNGKTWCNMIGMAPGGAVQHDMVVRLFRGRSSGRGRGGVGLGREVNRAALARKRNERRED